MSRGKKVPGPTFPLPAPAGPEGTFAENGGGLAHGVKSSSSCEELDGAVHGPRPPGVSEQKPIGTRLRSLSSGPASRAGT